MQKIEKIEKDDLGNTKKSSKVVKKQDLQKKNWFFTFNNYSPNDLEDLENYLNTVCDKYIFQEETGNDNTPHLQGSIILEGKGKRFTEMKKINEKIHWEITKNEQQSLLYCCKEDTRTGKVFYKGCKPKRPLKLITPDRIYQKEILSIIRNNADDRSIHWYYETIGNVEKSSFVKYLAVKENALFCDGTKKADLINLAYNNDMDLCDLIVFDIPRSTGNKISYQTLESLKNGLICNVKYETGTKKFNAPHIIIFANEPPNMEDKNLSLDRWNIFEIQKDYSTLRVRAVCPTSSTSEVSS